LYSAQDGGIAGVPCTRHPLLLSQFTHHVFCGFPSSAMALILQQSEQVPHRLVDTDITGFTKVGTE
jgi:hypothetical protein